MHTSLHAIAKALDSYDHARVANLSALDQSCNNAAHALSTQQGALGDVAPSARTKRIADAVHHAYQYAMRGFGACARGAHSVSYPLMLQADRDFQVANQWIRRAQALDR